MAKLEVGGVDIFLKDSDDIDAVYPKIEKLIGYKKLRRKSNR